MKTVIYLILAAMLPLCTANAEDKNDWMKEAIARERSRAQENMKNHSNTDKFHEKFGHLKEKHPDLLAALVTANKKAADAWDGVIRKAEGATHPDEIAEAKQVASAASGDAYLAEMTLKYASTAADRKGLTEKTRDRDVAALVGKLDANEKAILLATRTKNEAQASAEKLSNENRVLNNELRKAYDESRKKDEGKNRDSDHDKDRRDEEKKKNTKPGDGDEEGGTGVLGS
jgi:opacity protein-like surface antigen